MIKMRRTDGVIVEIDNIRDVIKYHKRGWNILDKPGNPFIFVAKYFRKDDIYFFSDMRKGMLFTGTFLPSGYEDLWTTRGKYKFRPTEQGWKNVKFTIIEVNKDFKNVEFKVNIDSLVKEAIRQDMKLPELKKEYNEDPKKYERERKEYFEDELSGGYIGKGYGGSEFYNVRRIS